MPPLPVSSFRLLVPPLQLLTASMWQAVKQHDALSYWSVAEFVSVVLDVVPELLMDKHRTQLHLGLRARYILELFRGEQLLQPEVIEALLSKMTASGPKLADTKCSEEEEAAANFPSLVQTLLKDPVERENFFMEVFPVEFGPQYDSDLKALFWEFLCRFDQLMPVPNIEQTAAWLGSDRSLLKDCGRSVCEPVTVRNLLEFHKSLRNLEQHVPPSVIGDSITSSLSVVATSRAAKFTEQLDADGQSDLLQDFGDNLCPLKSVVDDGQGEVVMVTEYAEVVLDTCANAEAVKENCFQSSEMANPEEMMQEVKAHEEEEAGGDAMETADAKGSVAVHEYSKSSSGSHDCPDCKKTFRFASSLTAHRVIHTGERPHKCAECGRCFSFRQSLDRHRHTHAVGRKYDCVICGETFHSLSARTQHKQEHMEDGVYSCPRCDRKFTWELSLSRHLKTHADDHNTSKPKIQEINVEHGCCPAAAVPLSACQAPELDDDDGLKEAQHDRADGIPNPGPMAPEVVDAVISLVKVRTSGRKRKPTMKIQVLNLQKNRGKVLAPETKEEDGKPLSYTCAEHSYGSMAASSDEGEGVDSTSKADEAEVQRHIDAAQDDDDKEASDSSLTEEEGRFSCPDCRETFHVFSLLKAHEHVHTGEKPFLCSKCGRRFSFRHSLDRHLQTHKGGRKYECLVCGELFKSMVAMREHNNCHMENGENMCSHCGRAFAWKSALIRHLKTHGEAADKAEQAFKCQHCDAAFSCTSHLSRHLQGHQEERQHTCSCGKSFRYRAALRAHQRIHLKERAHKCAQCGKGFLYRGGLLSHMKIHSEEKPFMCSHCGKSFKRERNMRKHERCHTRENVFSCSQCDKTFVYKATLVRHELTHSGERPYLCSDCGKGFFSHAELLKHERFHTGHAPFQCLHCGKRFTQSCYLTIHLRYHTGDRPYACPDCDKCFLTANRLKRHSRTHTGEKPFLCGECGKGFRQSYHLKMHQRTHTIKMT